MSLEELWENIDDNPHSSSNRSSGRLFLLSLTFSYFATGPLGVLTGLLLIDIALTYEVTVGIMGQINTVYYVVAVIFAFNHLLGISAVAIWTIAFGLTRISSISSLIFSLIIAVASLFIAPYE